MTPDDIEANQDESLADHAGREVSLELEQARFDFLIDLLAWFFWQRATSADPRLPANRPELPYGIAESRFLRHLSRHDPVAFDLQRFAVSAEILASVEEAADLDDGPLLRVAADLLASQRPARRSRIGDAGAVAVIVAALFFILAENGWLTGDRPKSPRDRKRRPEIPCVDYEVLAEPDVKPAKSATFVADLLQVHSLLAELPGAVPTADALRAVHDKNKRGNYRGWNELADFDEVLPPCIWLDYTT